AVALLPAAECVHLPLVGLALDAAVPGVVVLGAVQVAFAVRLVVLAGVRDQVAQREPIVAGEVVDRGERPPAVAGVAVRRAGQPVAEVAHAGTLTGPERAHGVPVAVVPLRPGRREPARQVATRPD